MKSRGRVGWDSREEKRRNREKKDKGKERILEMLSLRTAGYNYSK